MAKRGRPKIVIDWDSVEKLAEIQCTIAEIAQFIGVSESTLKNRKDFTTFYKKAREGGKSSLRRKQWRLADKNPSMAIWLGKQYLSQRDQPEPEQDAANIYYWHSIKDVAHTLFSDYQWTPLHIYLARIAEQFTVDYEYGLAPFVHLSLPPQHGKSENTRMMFARLINRKPDTKTSYISYNETFAKRNGTRPIRDWLKEYQPHLFNRSCEQNVGVWRTVKQGGMIAASPGGGLTGEKQDVLGFDDLIKNYAEYLSEAKRNEVVDFLDMVVRARLHNLTGIWSIGTRWGTRDAIDMIMERLGGTRNCKLINIPALAVEDDVLGREPGEALWPGRHSREHLEYTREIVGPLKFQAMWQGMPIDPMGEFFKYDKWTDIDKVPDTVKRSPWCRYWDLAFTKKGHGSAGALCCIDPAEAKILDCDGAEIIGKHYIRDIRTIRNEWPVIKKEIIRQAHIDGPGIMIGIEANGTQVGYYQAIREALPSEFKVFKRSSKPDKASDAQRWQSEQWGGLVHLLRGDWVGPFMKRADDFPGKDIDEIDAVSGAFWLARTFIPRLAEIYQR